MRFMTCCAAILTNRKSLKSQESRKVMHSEPLLLAQTGKHPEVALIDSGKATSGPKETYALDSYVRIILKMFAERRVSLLIPPDKWVPAGDKIKKPRVNRGVARERSAAATTSRRLDPRSKK